MQSHSSRRFNLRIPVPCVSGFTGSVAYRTDRNGGSNPAFFFECNRTLIRTIHGTEKFRQLDRVWAGHCRQLGFNRMQAIRRLPKRELRSSSGRICTFLPDFAVLWSTIVPRIRHFGFSSVAELFSSHAVLHIAASKLLGARGVWLPLGTDGRVGHAIRTRANVPANEARWILSRFTVRTACHDFLSQVETMNRLKRFVFRWTRKKVAFLRITTCVLPCGRWLCPDQRSPR